MLGDIYFSKLNIYGLRIYDYPNERNILFERKCDTLMNKEMIKVSREFYDNLEENKKKYIKLKIYTRCESKNNLENFMIWWKISPNEFLKKFNV